MKKNKLVSWITIAPIFADVLISPWNLLIGGLLIMNLSFPYALVSIFIGYIIIAFIFYFYGGLGLFTRKDTSHLIEPIFGEKGNKLFFSSLLAIGQIGWFGIINQIGGESLAVLLNLPSWLGIILYAFAMVVIATLSLYKIGIVKTLITASSILLLGYLIFVNASDFTNPQLLTFTDNKEGIAWGVAIIIASFISFISVSPDFTSQLQKKQDLVRTILLGVFIPGFIIATLGAILYFGNTNLSLISIIGITTFANFGHIFNVVTNTDSSIAIYTPGKRLQYIFKWPFVISVAIAAAIGTVLSLLNIQNQLVIWLSIIAGIYPGIIGVTLAHYLFTDKNYNKRKQKGIKWKSVIIILFSVMLIFLLNITLLNWVVGITSFVLYAAMLGVTIKIYIGNSKR